MVLSQGVVLVSGLVQAYLEHVLEIVSEIGRVQPVLTLQCHCKEVRTLPHPDVRGSVQHVPRPPPCLEVLALVKDRKPTLMPSAAHHRPPDPVGASPCGGGVPEGAGVEVVWEDDRIEVRLNPFLKVRVRDVLRVRHVLHLVLLGVDAGVKDHRAPAREDCGRPRPATFLVERFRRKDRRLQVFPVDEISGDGVCPHYVTPFGPVVVVLIEKMIIPIIKHWTSICQSTKFLSCSGNQ